MLHGFDRYLSPTENWIYRHLRGMERVQVVIAAREYRPGSLWDDRFQRIRYPVPAYRQVFRSRALDALHFKGLRAAWRGYDAYVAGRARTRGVDVVHSHFAPTAWMLRGIPERLRRPHVVSFYGYDYVMLPQSDPVWRERYSALFETAAAFVCEGPHAASLLRKQGCPIEKIRVVPIGVEVERIPVPPREKPAGRLRLVQVASYREKKGHRYTLDAFLSAAPRCPAMSLTFIGPGEGEIYEGLTRRAARSPHGSRVQFLPAVGPDELYGRLADHDVFIHPSVHAADGDCEGGAPIVLLEAQATGMPAIGTLHCDIPEEIRDGETGVLVPERDTETLADTLEAFYHMDAGEYARRSRSARAHVEERFDIRRSVALLEGLYAELRG